MNTSTGNVYETLEKANFFSKPGEEIIAVNADEMTSDQITRMKNDDQPVVKALDHRSILSKKMIKHQKYLDRKKKQKINNRKGH